MSPASPASTLSCYLVGAESLLAECGQILLDRGVRVLGVFSDAPLITQWAEQRDIACHAPGTLEAELAGQSFDYLLAIGQYEPLPDAVLGIATRSTINFHDGPLPEYSGLNVPAWAILNGETSHGISWEELAPGGGPPRVLLGRSVEVAADDTTLTLNTRCFEAAIESFPELLDRLESGSVAPEPPRRVEGRHYGAHDRPEAACTLDWRLPAARLERLVRALDHGPYANPMGAPKLISGDTRLVVTSARLGESVSGAEPGTVIGLSGDALVVATADGTLEIDGLMTLRGDAVELAELETRHGMHEGQRLESIASHALSRLTELGPVLAAGEDFWAARLVHGDPYQLPHGTAPSAETGHVSSLIELPAGFADRFASNVSDALVAACLVYLGRLGSRKTFQVGFSGTGLAREVAILERWIASRVPFQADLSAGDFAGALQALTAEKQRVAEHLSWLHDLNVRNPELKVAAAKGSPGAFPVAVAVREQISDFAPLEGEQLVFVIASGTCSVVASRKLPPEVRNAVSAQLRTVLQALGDAPETPLSRLPLLDEAERRRVLRDWNDTAADYRRDRCVHELFEERVDQRPDAPAIFFEGETLSYGELDARANQLAAHLRQAGVGPESMVGLHVERSIELVLGALAIQKAGGAYVPLDPDYPRERIAFMIEDSGIDVLVTQQSLAGSTPDVAHVIQIDADWPRIAEHPRSRVDGGAGPENIAYVIYTSGSTGKPKGVMVEHRNVANFFAGMDGVIAHDTPGTWLAVTSLSFDISVLELFWTLAHGFEVVLHRERTVSRAASSASDRELGFGLFLWGSEDTVSQNKYRLMLDAARFADERGFVAMWTPERHFHAFGGPYPNPSITGAAIGAVTQRIQVRAGSCVAPLHHPARIAEEWAVVDNLTGGRVGISFASGWNPNDFLLRPETFGDAKQVMIDHIDTVRRLWRGEAISFPGALGKDVEVVTQPRPLQPELPFWVTTAGNPDTYRQAGAMGANVLTHLLGQSLEEVGEKIQIYRKARADNGFDPSTGIVSLMLHTFVGDDVDEVRELVREPMKEYLRSSVSLIKNFAWSFSAFKRPEGATTAQDVDLQQLSAEEMDAILNAAFERYFETSGLFGTPDKCMELVEQAKQHGIDEIACLIDYGVPTEQVLQGLERLDEVRRRAVPTRQAIASAPPKSADYSIPALIREHRVTHLQCTPSMARMLTMDPEARHALTTIQHMMVGGEAFPVELGRELTGLIQGTVTNMYGPTETTIWSSTHGLTPKPASIPIGRPIANTQLYILDEELEPLPVGVPGELYIGGDGVVRGYHARAELTAERFVPDPFRGGSHRIYRTGDLARYRDDGSIDYLGRTDFQVKLRGHRIELGEIETRLSEHGAVAECVVSAREDIPGDQRLVAYVVTSSAVEEATLKDHLRGLLPDYMVPSHVVELPRLPLTPNGKVDRKALPAPKEVQRKPTAPHQEPQGELQARIAAAWRETLGLDRVSATDNFFDIGGHSLLVVQLHRRLAASLDNPLSLTDLYRFPTIASLAEHLAEGGDTKAAERTAERASRRRELLQKRRRRGRRA